MGQETLSLEELQNDSIHAQYKAEVLWQSRVNNLYPIILYTLLVITLGCAIIAERWREHQYLCRLRGQGRDESWFARLDTWWSHRLLIQPLHPRHHLVPYRNRIIFPTRAQSLAISAYVVLHVVLFFGPPIRLYDEDVQKGIPSKSLQLSKYAALRCGSLVFIQLPLLALTGSPARVYADYILQWTGTSREAINIFHRWVGRTVWTETLGHVIIYTIKICYLNPRKPGRDVWGGILDGIIRILWLKPINQFGFAAFIGMSFLALPSLRSVRSANGQDKNRAFTSGYEVFLFFHFTGIIIASVCAFFHLYITKQKKWWWVVAFATLWLFDRLGRLRRRRCATAHAVLSKAGVIALSLDVPLAKGEDRDAVLQSWTGPGRVIQLSMGGWHNTHPFSVAGVHSQCPLESPVSSNSLLPPEPDTIRLVLYMRALQGFTRQVWASHHARRQHPTDRSSSIFTEYGNRPSQYLLPRESLPPPPTVQVEGPYGQSLPLHRFDAVTLVAGGVGAALIITYLEKLVEDASTHDDHDIHRTACLVPQTCFSRLLGRRTDYGAIPMTHRRALTRRVRFIWVVREWDEVHVLRKRLQALALTTSGPNAPFELQMDIYITRKTPGTSPHWTTHGVRPDLYALMKEETDACERGLGCRNLGVVACGSASILDGMRFAAARLARERSTLRLCYYEEGYSW